MFTGKFLDVVQTKAEQVDVLEANQELSDRQSLKHSYDVFVDIMLNGDPVEQSRAISSMRNSLRKRYAKRGIDVSRLERRFKDLEVLVRLGKNSDKMVDKLGELGATVMQDGGPWLGQLPVDHESPGQYGSALLGLVRELETSLDSAIHNPNDRSAQIKAKDEIRGTIDKIAEVCSKTVGLLDGDEEMVNKAVSARNCANDLLAATPYIDKNGIDTFLAAYERDVPIIRELGQDLREAEAFEAEQEKTPVAPPDRDQGSDKELSEDVPEAFTSEAFQTVLTEDARIGIVGEQGTGKSATAWALTEVYPSMYGYTSYGVEIPPEVEEVIPDDIETMNDFSPSDVEKIPPESFVLFDEAYNWFPGGTSTSDRYVKFISDVLQHSRHEHQSFCFVLPRETKLSPSIVRQINCWLIKPPRKTDGKMRSGRDDLLRDVFQRARDAFAEVENPERHIYVYSTSMVTDYEGLEKVELPSFWNDESEQYLSRIQHYRKKHGMTKR